jgi:sugar phosphate permease
MSDQSTGVLVGLLLGAAAGIGAATAMLKLLYNPRITYAVRIVLGFICVGLFIFGPIFLLVLVTRRLGLHTNGAGLEGAAAQVAGDAVGGAVGLGVESPFVPFGE